MLDNRAYIYENESADSWPRGQGRELASSISNLYERLIDSMPFCTFSVQYGVIFVLWYKILNDIGTDYVLDVSPIQPLERDVGVGLLCTLLCSEEQVMNLHKMFSRQHRS